MINTPTVLVLGAGASMPYGFPSGKQLKEEIISKTFPSVGKDWFLQIGKIGVTPQEMKKFGKELQLSGLPSVDAFLEYRPDLERLGKLAIARELIPREDNHNLYNVKDENWYEYLLTRLYCPIERYGDNKLSIITFNYDRSLEQFLFNHLTSSFNVPFDIAVDALDKIPIIHVYGKLCDLKWKNENGRRYSLSFNHEDLEKAADQIKIISESDPNTSEFNKAHKLMAEAEKIYFFGFGYHDANLKRLSIKTLESKIMKGTTWGLGGAEIRQINEKWNIGLNEYSLLKIFGFLKDVDSLT